MQGQREHMSHGHLRVAETAVSSGSARERARALLGALVVRLLSLGRAALHALIPRRCAACDEPLADGDLCRPCEDTLVEAEEAAALAPFAYGGAIAEAVRGAKFRPDERPARALARLFTRAALEAWPDLGHSVDVVAWVPLHPRRLRTRGFDLAALLAHALARPLSLPCRPLLTCVRHDPPLSRGADVAERARRVRDRYQASEVEGLRVLLVDDVVTTGATLGEATRVLLAAGAREVIPVALAATPSWRAQAGPSRTRAMP